LPELVEHNQRPPEGQQGDLPQEGQGEQGSMLLVTSLPNDVARVTITTDLTKDAMAQLGAMRAHEIDWDRVANHCGVPGQAQILNQIATRTKWRRAPAGRGHSKLQQFSATQARGAAVGKLGSNLAVAVIQLYGRNLHNKVNTL
jgi:hypothetical protein